MANAHETTADACDQSGNGRGCVTRGGGGAAGVRAIAAGRAVPWVGGVIRDDEIDGGGELEPVEETEPDDDGVQFDSSLGLLLLGD